MKVAYEYSVAYKVTLIPGDGIGPEVAEAARRVIDASGIDVIWRVAAAGQAALESYGEPLPEATLESVRSADATLKGPTATPSGVGCRSINVGLRACGSSRPRLRRELPDSRLKRPNARGVSESRAFTRQIY